MDCLPKPSFVFSSA